MQTYIILQTGLNKYFFPCSQVVFFIDAQRFGHVIQCLLSQQSCFLLRHVITCILNLFWTALCPTGLGDSSATDACIFSQEPWGHIKPTNNSPVVQKCTKMPETRNFIFWETNRTFVPASRVWQLKFRQTFIFLLTETIEMVVAIKMTRQQRCNKLTLLMLRLLCHIQRGGGCHYPASPPSVWECVSYRTTWRM